MSRTFVVPDAHGNLKAVFGLLREAKIVNEDGKRIDWDTKVVQLGDLCNCVISSIGDDLDCLNWVKKWFDIYLVGNHEHPYFGGPPFSGWFKDPEIFNCLNSLNAQGFIYPCVAVDDILVSHAGLTKDWPWRKAETAERDLNDLWRNTSRSAEPFSRIGWSRGGRDKYGGILWADWDEPKTKWFSQLVGHTVDTAVRTHHYGTGKFITCIDTGGGKHGKSIAGAWIEDGEVRVIRADV